MSEPKFPDSILSSNNKGFLRKDERSVFSDEVLTLDIRDRSRTAQVVMLTQQELINAEKWRRAREKDMALGVFCGFPYARGIRM